MRDPGGDNTKGPSLHAAIGAAVDPRGVGGANGAKGSDVEGYRDYRGVEVVGAWDWVPELDLGISTEMDATEALAGLHLLKIAFWSRPRRRDARRRAPDHRLAPYLARS